MRKTTLFLSLALLMFSTCRSDKEPAQENEPASSALATTGPGPEVTTIGFSRQDTVLQYSLDIKYPAIREHPAFNAAVNSNLSKAIDEFTAFIKGFNSGGRTMSSAYQLIQNTNRVTSIRQMYEWAVPGTSTLQYRFYNINYNPEAQELISLESLFRDGVNYQKLLKKRLEEKIEARFKVDVEVTEEDLQSFVIGQDFLEFYKVLYPAVMDPEPKAFQVKFSELEGAWK